MACCTDNSEESFEMLFAFKISLCVLTVISIIYGYSYRSGIGLSLSLNCVMYVKDWIRLHVVNTDVE